MFKQIISFIISILAANCAFGQTVETAGESLPRELDSVLVTGQFRPGTLRNSIYKVRTISNELIRSRAVTDVPSLLSNELGFRFSNDYTLGESDLSVMGMGGNNVKILLDGVPLVDRGSNKQSLSQIDVNIVERIEIVEGPMSVVYGTDALAGVINIITRKASRKNQISAFARVQEESVGKTYDLFNGDGLHQAGAGVDGAIGNWKAGISISRNDFGGWKGYNQELRVKDMKPKEQWFGGATLGYAKNNFSAVYRLDYLNENIDVAGRYNQNNTALDANYLTDRFTHQLQLDWRPGSRFQWLNSLSYQDYQRQTETYLLNFVNGTKAPSVNAGEWDLSTFKTYFGRSMATWKISDKFSWQPGFEFKRDEAAGDRIEGSPAITDIAFFNSVEYQPFKRLLIRPGIRFSHNSTYDAPPLIPSLNIKYGLNDQFDLRASYARGFRAPALRELYFYFFDANHSIEGNPDLEAEYSNSFNASITWNGKAKPDYGVSSSLSGFYNAFNNRISLAQGDNNVFTYFNLDKYRNLGFTTENKFWTKRFNATLGFSYIARFNEYQELSGYKETSGKEYAWSPELNSNISYQIPRIEVQVGFFYKFNGKLPAFRTGTDQQTSEQIIYLSETEAYHWADLSFGKTFFQSLTLQAGVKNLFDVSRLQNTAIDGGAAHSSSGPVLMAYGRSGFVGLRYQFQSKNKNK